MFNMNVSNPDQIPQRNVSPMDVEIQLNKFRALSVSIANSFIVISNK